MTFIIIELTVACSGLHRMNRFARGTESLTVTCGLMDGLSPSSVRVFKSHFFKELCIAALFLTFSNTAANYRPTEWVNTHEFTCAACPKQPG